MVSTKVFYNSTNRVGLEKLEHSIKEAGKFDILRFHWSEICKERKRKKRSGLRRKSKVSTLDSQIKRSRLKVSNSFPLCFIIL